MIGKTLLRWSIAVLSLFAIILIILLTPLGLKIGMTLATKLVPGHLQYQKITGIVTGPITIKNLRYDYEKTHISIKDFEMHWQPIALLWGKLSITQLNANHVHLTLSNTIKTKDKKSTSFFIQIQNAKLRNVAIGTQAKQYPTFIRQIDLKSTIIPENVAIQASAILEKPFPLKAQFHADGNFSKYSLTLHVTNPHMDWLIYGKGNEESMVLRTQKSQVLGGNLSANAHIQWAPYIKWKLALNAHALNLNTLEANWPHQLSMQLNTHGEIIKNLPHFFLKTSIKTPQATVALLAKQNTTLHVEWNAAIDRLAALIPGGKGSLYSKGNWTGTSKHPKTQGNINAKNISLDGYHADSLQGSWNLNLHPNSRQQSHFTFNASKLSTKSIRLEALQLQAKGSQQSHQLSGKIAINHANFIFKMQGGWSAKRWEGRLEKLDILSSRFAHWRLEKPGRLSLSSTQIITPNLCLRSTTKSGILCFDGQWDTNKAWAFTVKGRQVDTGLLTSLVLPKLTISATSNLDARVSGYRNKLNNVSAKLLLKSGRFRYFLGGNSIGSPFQTSNISLTLNASGLRSKVHTILSKNNTINIALSVPHYLSAMKNPKINGKIDVKLTSLKLFATLIPDIVKPSGKLQAHLSLNGRLNNPRVSGKLHFQDGSLELTNLGIELKKISMDLASQGNGITYTAKAFSENSPIQIKGKSEWSSQGLKSNFTVTTDNTRIMNTPEYILYASLKLQFHVLNKKVHMKGDINIPKGLVQPHAFTNVETIPSSQIIFIGKPPTKKAHQWKIFAKVKITLGKDVTVNTHGLHADITGQATLTGNPHQDTLATGQINVVKGKYTTYGKTLTIQPGSSLQFNNSPVANPNLNLRAIKKISITQALAGQRTSGQPIIVGVSLTGTFRHIKIQLFSIPATLSQADILSYLVLGYGTGTKSSGADVSLLLQAASSLQLGGKGAGIGGAISQVRQGLGLAEFGLESETMVDAIGTPIEQQTAFVVGKHLTPRIYIRYSIGFGQGPFTPVNLFQLRYLLRRNWILQTDSSTLGNGIDILYTIDK